jgi:hypothetical protein
MTVSLAATARASPSPVIATSTLGASEQAGVHAKDHELYVRFADNNLLRATIFISLSQLIWLDLASGVRIASSLRRPDGR